MVDLPRAQLRHLLDLVGEVNDAEDPTAFRAALLPGLARLVPSDWVAYNEVWPATGRIEAETLPAVPDWVPAVWSRLVGDGHPIVNHHQRTRDGRPYRLSDFLTPAELRASPIYTELYAKIGMAHQIAFTLPSAPQVTIGVALSRAADPDYSERDRAVLDLARPHLVQAWRNAGLRHRARTTLEALGTGLEDAGVQLVLVDGDAEVTFCSPGATQALMKMCASEVRDGEPLPEPLRTWHAGGAAAPMVRDGVVVRHLPGRPGLPATLAVELGSASLSTTALQGLGLTAREADVLRWIALGRSSADAAERLGTSPRTVHKHLEHVYAKLGVSSRSEAAAVAWASVGLPTDAAP